MGPQAKNPSFMPKNSRKTTYLVRSIAMENSGYDYVAFMSQPPRKFELTIQ